MVKFQRTVNTYLHPEEVLGEFIQNCPYYCICGQNNMHTNTTKNITFLAAVIIIIIMMMLKKRSRIDLYNSLTCPLSFLVFLLTECVAEGTCSLWAMWLSCSRVPFPSLPGLEGFDIWAQQKYGGAKKKKVSTRTLNWFQQMGLASKKKHKTEKCTTNPAICEITTSSNCLKELICIH